MYTFTILKSQVTNKLQRYIGPQKVQIWTEKSPKWAGLTLFWAVNLNFPEEGRKKSFYTKKSAKFNEPFGRYKPKC